MSSRFRSIKENESERSEVIYHTTYSLFVSLLGLTDPVLIRLDVDSKLSEQLKVGLLMLGMLLP